MPWPSSANSITRTVHGFLGGVQVTDEVCDPAVVLVAHDVRLAVDVVGPFVGERDRQAPVEERHLLHPPGQGLEVPRGGLEYRLVRPERDRGTGLVRGLAPDDRPRGLADVIGLPPGVAVPANLYVEPGRQGVDHGNADAVQPAGDGVGLAVELAARVQGGQHDLDRGPLFHRVQCRPGCRGRCRPP